MIWTIFNRIALASPRALAAVLGLAGACALAQPRVLGLDEALSLAERSHPTLQAARAEITAARAEDDAAHSLLWNNPQLNVEARQRRLGQVAEPDASRRDAAIGFSQTFETGGQRAARRDAAGGSLSAARLAVEATRREVRAEAAQRFFQALSLQQRLRAEEESLELLRKAAMLVQRRVTEGEDSRLDGNLASVEAERSANQLAQVGEQLLQARSALATAVQLPPEALPEVAHEGLAEPNYTLQDLLESAARQPTAPAAAAREQAAAGRLALERAAASPDVTLGLSSSVERSADVRDRITTLSLSVPLPLFHRNEAAIGRASSDLERLRIERQTALRDAQAAVRLGWLRRASLGQRLERLLHAVLPKLEANQRLSFAALQAGEIGLGQYLLARRQALDAQRDVLDATSELQQARVELESAAGWPQVLPPLDGSPRTGAP